MEVYERKPLSYMTETAAGLLAELAGKTTFVPTTTRTREQYGRIHLPGPEPEFAICANGGHLLVRGESDPDWQRTVAERLAAQCAPLDEIRAHLVRTADPAWLLKERVAEDLFAYLVVERPLLPDAWVKNLAGWADERGWTVSLQGRKIYAVPQPLTKSAAVAEVARRTGASEILAAGDSLLDADLLLAADRGWRPGHGELADAGWRAPMSRRSKSGVLLRARKSCGPSSAVSCPRATPADAHHDKGRHRERRCPKDHLRIDVHISRHLFPVVAEQIAGEDEDRVPDEAAEGGQGEKGRYRHALDACGYRDEAPKEGESSGRRTPPSSRAAGTSAPSSRCRRP